LAEHKTEPNSGLGKAISYLLNHWTKLTLVLRQAGSPIDNDIVERSLKKAILNRRNALFYKTQNGACELNGANPFDYLTELLRHPEELKRSPSEWMPWNYRETLARLAQPAAAYDESCMAEKDRGPAMLGDIPKTLENESPAT